MADVTTLALSHAKTVLLVELVALLEAEEFANRRIVFELIVVSGKVEGCGVGALMDQVDDVGLAREGDA